MTTCPSTYWIRVAPDDMPGKIPPFGTVAIGARGLPDGEAIVALEWGPRTETSEPIAPTPLLQEAKRQLLAYLAGRLRKFDLPLRLEGTAFRRKVWRAIAAIPYGQTLTYGEIARRIGGAPRAVGGGCGANPIPLIVPCHRVLAAGGRIGGFSGAGKLASKNWLLTLEGVYPLRNDAAWNRVAARAPDGRSDDRDAPFGLPQLAVAPRSR